MKHYLRFIEALSGGHFYSMYPGFKKTLVSLSVALMTLPVLAQNLIENPDFEQGSVPTALGQVDYATSWSQPCTDAYMYTAGQTAADLLDRNSTNPATQVPVSHWTHGFELEEEDGDDRYAHLWQTENAATGPGGAAQLKGERITGTLTETLGAGCYSLCFWSAVMPHDATIQPGVFVDTNPLTPGDLNKQIMEVLLVSGNSCTGHLLFETPAVPDDSVWHQYCTEFTLSDADAGVYDHILFRIKDDGNANGNQFSMFLDETELYSENPSINISGVTQFCSGQSTTLTADSGYDNYLWSNGATTPSIVVSSGGTYTVTAWDDGSGCPATGSVVVTAMLPPKIDLPDEVSVCNEHFQALCGPSNTGIYTFTYSWYYNDPGTMTSYLVSNNQCYIPDQYGSYTLVVGNQYGCYSSHTIHVVEGFGPAVHIKNVYYCKAAPAYIGLPGPYADALSYEWTYDDGSGAVPVPGPTGYQIPNMGDGEYCVTVHWSSTTVPSLSGCTSTACFVVEQCCKPDPDFILTFDTSGPTATITVQNNPLNALHYDSEQFVLYQYCGSETDLNLITWTQIASTPWNTDFNTPVTFAGLDEDCLYKVVHRVTVICSKKISVSGQIAGLVKIAMYPNPVEADGVLTIAMSRPSPQADVEIRDILTGQVVFRGILEYRNPLSIEHAALRSGIYAVKVSNEAGSITEKLMVK